jgi:starch synthase
MKDKRVLFVSSEVVPYLPETEISSNSFQAAKMVNSIGGQTRIFMPRFGNINERRHQLHEVIRLSGMNLVINDLDMPLIIKVASIPKERMQVYFIDNEEYFKRKATFTDEDGALFKDNDERAIFFAKGVIETVKKLNWAPDVIHVHGWLASLLPLYLKKYFADEPLFTDSKVVTSIYSEGFDGELGEGFREKIKFDNIDGEAIKVIENATYDNMMKLAAENSDGVIIGSEDVNSELMEYLSNSETPTLDYKSPDEFESAYTEFYNSLMA